MSEEKTGKGFPPNEQLKPFGPIIGEWKTVGSHPMIPNTTLHGRAAFSWHESGAFVVLRTHIEEDVGVPDGVAIIGSDGTLGKYVMIYYDVRGVSRHYQLSIEENVIKWWRDAPEFSQRNTLTISADGQTIVGKGEICKDGSTWEQDLDLTYTRA